MIKYLRCLAVIALMFSLGSCLKNSSTPQAGYTALYVIQASPNAPLTDIYINNDLSLPNTAYGTDTGYVYPAPGNYEFKVAQAGTSTTFLTKSFNLDTSKFYSIYFIDSVSKMKAALVEDNFSLPGTDTVQIRYLDFSPNLIIHNVKFINIATSEVFQFTGRTFNDQEGASYKADFSEIKAGKYNIEFYLFGSGTPFKTISNYDLKSQKAYTFYMKGFYNGTGAQAIDCAVIQHLL